MAAAALKRVLHWAYEYVSKPLAIASCFVIVALLWTFPLQHIIEYPFVFLFFGAIMGSAWFGGIVAVANLWRNYIFSRCCSGSCAIHPVWKGNAGRANSSRCVAVHAHVRTLLRATLMERNRAAPIFPEVTLNPLRE